MASGDAASSLAQIMAPQQTYVRKDFVKCQMHILASSPTYRIIKIDEMPLYMHANNVALERASKDAFADKDLLSEKSAPQFD